MAEHSSIEWTEATWNPIAGCSLVSPGCTNCYAMRRVAPRLSANPATPHYHGTVQPSKGGPVWTGKIGIASDAVLLKPLSWRRPRMIFVNSTSDLFHEGVPDAVIDRIFAVMALCPQHTFQVLTKRPERMRAYVSALHREPKVMFAADPMFRGRFEAGGRQFGHIRVDDDSVWHIAWPLPNVWLGTSVEDQQRADERIPHLLATPAAVRFISAEPLLGPIDLHEYLLGFSVRNPASCACGHGHGFTRCPNYGGIGPRCHKCTCAEFQKAPGSDGLHWVIVGGESGEGARPMHPDWARSLRDQCAAAGVPFFFKQWGNFVSADQADTGTDYAVSNGPASGEWERGQQVNVGTKAAGRLLDGIEHNAFPEIRP